MDSITVEGLTRTYLVRRSRREGTRRSWRRPLSEVHAVRGVSFSIAKGEIVGFLGPNGAGKTTVLKCLSGIITPTSGRALVLGHIPHRREQQFLRRITLVMGQKNQLLWDLPVEDSFRASRAIYGLDAGQYRANRGELVELLGLDAIIDKPVRQLSLGERAKCEIAVALLHRPEVLFLDEPTLGLDVGAQKTVLNFVREYAEQTGCTVMLTSHYLGDITTLASRVVVIGHGEVTYDSSLSELISQEAPEQVLKLTLRAEAKVEVPQATRVSQVGNQVVAYLPREAVSTVAPYLLEAYDVSNISVAEVPLEDLLERKITEAGAAP